MIVCVPIEPDGSVGHSWGRAPRVAIVRVEAGAIDDWQEYGVRWDELHDEGTEGGHHARIATFLRDHGVEAVVAGHMGAGMLQMLPRMGMTLHLGAGGDARAAVVAAVREAAAGSGGQPA